MNHRVHVQTHGIRAIRRAGFTLIELLVVIAIIAILIAILFPILDRRQSFNLRSAHATLGLLSQKVYHEIHAGDESSERLFPGPVSPDDRFWADLASNSGLEFDDAGDSLIGHGYRFQYGASDHSYFLMASPVSPGLTGSATMLLTGSADDPPPQPEDVEFFPTSGAEANRTKAITSLKQHAQQSIAEVLVSGGTGQSLAVSFVSSRRNVEDAFDELAGGDGLVSFDDLATAPIHPTLRDRLIAELRLGDGGENLGQPDLDVTIDELDGSPADLLKQKSFGSIFPSASGQKLFSASIGTKALLPLNPAPKASPTLTVKKNTIGLPSLNGFR